MQNGSYPDIAPDFGHWLAGLFDGEGHFQIERRSRAASSRQRTGDYRTYGCRAVIGLRADDAQTLEVIARTTGLGKPYTCHPKSRRGVGAPITYWQVTSQMQCLRLVAIFDAYQLRSKKARDYAIWREAVLEWTSVVAPDGPARFTYRGRDWSKMEELRTDLMAGRKYREVA